MNRIEMKYGITYAKTAEELEVEVNRLMAEGWQPLGGIATISELIGMAPGKLDSNTALSRNRNMFYQAMIRE